MPLQVQGKIVTREENFHIQPRDIALNSKEMCIGEAFYNRESEIAAYFAVRLAQELGGWHPFTLEQIEEFYERAGGRKRFTFGRLVKPEYVGRSGDPTGYKGGGWIVLGLDGKYRVTDDFILRCHQSSLAGKEIATRRE